MKNTLFFARPGCTTGSKLKLSFTYVDVTYVDVSFTYVDVRST
jgi:hypothetical protein